MSLYSNHMTECYTEALVLEKESSGEEDAKVILFTKELGKISAKIKSARKILSKLNGHLEPLNLVKVRLINKNKFQVADVLRVDALPIENFAALRLIKEMSAEEQPDLVMWNLIVCREFAEGKILAAAGFDPQFAVCQNCGSISDLKFSIQNLEYFCQNCFN